MLHGNCASTEMATLPSRPSRPRESDTWIPKVEVRVATMPVYCYRTVVSDID
jgi:hypothetical protein